ncbi:TetR/AcrR family transcriptional regulator [Paenibacillus cymbidii]|uniref:TetR/AcrR family transcriptional regulator n=1 Tax=Paenibacillus cymbidii TaxID=1639034 RepID=UPI001436B1C4|nr:TetR/AcrR family transcriptional regulator [Paenibacillus cymbidii]
MDRKQQIMEAAVRHFADKGYHDTSIQEIVDSLGIAKGSLYVHFKSKDELLVSICRHYTDRLAAGMTEIVDDAQLAPREKLIGLVLLVREQFVQFGDFFKLLLRERLDLNEQIRPVIFALGELVLRGYQTCIAAHYGEEAEPYTYDAAVLFDATITGYFKYMLLGQQKLDFGVLADFLVSRLDDMMRGLLASKPQPLLGEANFARFEDFSQLFGGGKRRDVFDELAETGEWIARLAMPPEQREELETALHALVAEFRKPEPRKVIVKGLLALLRGAGQAELDARAETIAEYLPG